MEIIRTKNKLGQASIFLQLSSPEYLVVRKGIAECTGGIRIKSRRRELGVSDSTAYGLYEYIDLFRDPRRLDGKNFIVLRLTQRECHALRKAITLTLDELGEREYPGRTGLDFDESKQILDEFDRVLESTAKE
jgi:hypothetical protein